MWSTGGSALGHGTSGFLNLKFSSRSKTGGVSKMEAKSSSSELKSSFWLLRVEGEL